MKYFDGQLSYAEVDQQSDALARALRAGGLVKGDRVALFLQNVPQFVLALAGNLESRRRRSLDQSHEP